jgi:hypothetical protein
MLVVRMNWKQLGMMIGREIQLVKRAGQYMPVVV